MLLLALTCWIMVRWEILNVLRRIEKWRGVCFGECVWSIVGKVTRRALEWGSIEKLIITFIYSPFDALVDATSGYSRPRLSLSLHVVHVHITIIPSVQFLPRACHSPTWYQPYLAPSCLPSLSKLHFHLDVLQLLPKSCRLIREKM